MARFSRRDFMSQGCFGLATAGTAGVVLLADVPPTQASGGLGSYAGYLQEKQKKNGGKPARWAPTEDNILGPFHRENAPYRAKITPPLSLGTVLVISGRVWGHDNKKPLPNTVVDIWQANHQGRYDNDDPKNPPARDVFLYRARLITDENGFYEYETVHPGAYRIDQTTWRPSHIHYWVRHPNYRALITQLYFRGDKHNKTDAWIRESLIIDLREHKAANNQTYKTGTFDIVLAPNPR